MPQSVTSAQVRAARALLNWSVRELADRSGVHRNTITNFETGKSGGDANTIAMVRSTLEVAGVIFLDDSDAGFGVRFRKGHPDESDRW